MSTQNFKYLNTIGGWVAFFIATVVYTLTMEGTASLWDCGEFVASAYKLQVVHPPGAPTFLMIGRMFTFLALGDVELMALALNFMSALCSGFSIMFLFWITTHLAHRILVPIKSATISTENVMAILGGGFIAALTCTFADSVWFSAVEAEVYSMSLLCTAIVFWSMLKWEERADEPYADRWLLFICFLVGTSIFIHWLNLLCIPAMVLLYYFKRYDKHTNKGMLAALVAGVGIVGFILWFVIPGIVDIVANFELAFVNSFGLPFNSGLITSLVLMIGGLAKALHYTYKNDKPVLHNALLGLMFILIGYSSIATVVIRSNAGPNIDMNSPRDAVSLSSYLKREQYGSRPFLFGYYYTAPISDVIELGKKYQRGEDRYDVVGRRIDYAYKGKRIFFPRIYDTNNVANYEKWLGLRKGEKPSYADNLYFFFRYQIGHMYVRYLMWNFVGRQNDEQGLGGRKDGNWISGIPFIDAGQVGSQANLPAHIKDNPSRNTFYFLPLLLGLLGLVFQFTNDKNRSLVILLLFLLAGVAIIVQGNSPPIEPRERDYIFAGSFWTFTIWIGLGMVALYDLLRSKIDGKMAAIAAISISMLAPLLMGFQGWDDHDRSGRYAARDFAANYLNSCAPNAIIFTQGDNDTYPLWYAQEVENIRRDVRVVNLSLLGVDWYINQLRRKVNDAAPVPMSMTPAQIRGTKRDVVYNEDNEQIVPANTYVPLPDILEFIASDEGRTKLRGQSQEIDYYPTRNFSFKVDKAKVLAQNSVAPEDEALMVDELQWTINKRSLYKNDLMVLDIISANNWERPIYFAISVSPGSYLGLEKYFQLEGLAYRLMPVKVTPPIDPLTGQPDKVMKGRVNPDIMYDNLMRKFRFGAINQADAHVDADLRRMIFNFRGNFARLADALIRRGDNEKAIEVLDRAQEVMPDKAAPYNFYMYTILEAYYDAGAYEKANELTTLVADRLITELQYIKGLPKRDQKSWEAESQLNEYFIRKFSRIAQSKGQNEFANELEQKLNAVK